MTHIRQKTEQTRWAGPLLRALREELDAFAAGEGFRIPEEPGGWWHQYVCPEHHAELLFDPMEADAAAFRCPHGCVLSGEPYRGAWLVYKHQSLARYALQAAAVYAATGEARYAELGRTVLERYARQFPRYPVHPDAQPWMLKGRAFHQALTEAIWATTLIRAYVLLRDEGVDFAEAMEPLTVFFGMLEESMTQYRHILIHERKNPENNYTAWLNAALAGVYAATGERGKLEALLTGEGGVRHHLTIGVKPDQFEFEGSTYYHVFVLRAYMIAAEMAGRAGIDIYRLQGDGGQTFEGMFDVLAGLAGERGYLPALHDGPYWRTAYAREIAEIFEAGLAKYGKPEYVPVLAEAYRQLASADGAEAAAAAVVRGGAGEAGSAAVRCSLEALVYGEGDADLAAPMPPRPSLWLPDSGFAVGRVQGNPLSFLCDFGAHGGSHGHFDKLHLSLEHADGPVAPELGMVPYGSALRKEWYALTASHNTVAVGGRTQAPHTGEAVRWSAGAESAYLWTRSTGAYPGCVLERHLYLTKDFLLDWFDVRLEGGAQTIDWWYHGDGSLEPAVGDWSAADVERPGETDGYGYVRVAGQASANASALARADGGWQHAAGTDAAAGSQQAPGTVAVPGALHALRQRTNAETEITLRLWGPASAVLYRVETPGTADDPARPMAGLLLRATGTETTFAALYRAGSAPAELRYERAEPAAARIAEAEFSVRTESGSWRFTFDAERGLSGRRLS